MDGAITALGWVATFIIQLIILMRQERSAHTLKSLEHEFERTREARQRTIPPALARLDTIETWFSRGMTMQAKVNFVNFSAVAVGETKTEQDRHLFMTEYQAWLAEADRMFAIALQIDPNTPDKPGKLVAPPVDVDYDDLPTDLPSLIPLLRHSIADVVVKTLNSKASKDFIVPMPDTRAIAIFGRSLEAADRIRKHISTGK
jgi:hypothetical protein